MKLVKEEVVETRAHSPLFLLLIEGGKALSFLSLFHKVKLVEEEERYSFPILNHK